MLPLAFNIINDEQKEKAIKNLLETITRENTTDCGKLCPSYSLMTGFIGTAWIGKALSDNGYSDIAYRLLQQTSYPSWLYSVEQRCDDYLGTLEFLYPFGWVWQGITV